MSFLFSIHNLIKSQTARLLLSIVTVTTSVFLTVSEISAIQDKGLKSKDFVYLITGKQNERQKAYKLIEDNWEMSFVPMILEVIYLNRDALLNKKLMGLLENKTSQNHGYDFNNWYKWLWGIQYESNPMYPNFKAALYSLIDPKFESYFRDRTNSTIRLDEVRWGGVIQDGIPPLRSPKMIEAKDSDYLSDNNVVFGIEIDGDVRAYPKRILAWHEMFIDTVGDQHVTGVYCTLCGSMILYKSKDKDGVVHELGTSGFLYRSNKLMYDKSTQSLWNTIWGKPVLGPLIDKNIELERLSIVTTTWGEWRRRHPQTKVLSINTGYTRDYSEGAAYREYFATDELMFNVPVLDSRLKNKDEVLGLIFTQYLDKPLAISARYLINHPVYHDEIDGFRFIVFTDKTGANRVYEAKDESFVKWDQNNSIIDNKGIKWQLEENYIESDNGQILYRLPSHRAFWFGWYSAYSHTRLVK